MRCWARFKRAPATIFMARVIFCVLLTVAMRLRIALRFAIGLVLRLHQSDGNYVRAAVAAGLAGAAFSRALVPLLTNFAPKSLSAASSTAFSLSLSCFSAA